MGYIGDLHYMTTRLPGGMSSLPASPIPALSGPALMEAWSALQQYDFDAEGFALTPLAAANITRRIKALEAKLEAIEAGAATRAQVRSFARWLRDWIDENDVDSEGYWSLAYKWALQGA